MSSSTDPASLKCDFSPPVNASLDESPGFRRWSRNISAHRNQELERLNQIERTRQLLELKRQNDLFDQMSLAASEREIVKDQSKRETTKAFKEKSSPIEYDESDSLPFKTDGSATATLKFNVATSKRLSSTTHDGNHVHSSECVNKEETNESCRVDSVLASSRLTSQSESIDDDNGVNNDVDDDDDDDDVDGGGGDGDGQVGDACHKNEVIEPTKIKTSRAKASGEKSQSMNLSSPQPLNSKGDFVEKSKTKPASAKQRVKKPMNLEQVKEFVSSRVPQNKRVLCLIVRDKLSKLNKAKSYFYPTYYLFIQAIVDINQKSVDTQSNKKHSNDDLQTVLKTSTSVDNSFSASSSISADMMFIGSNSLRVCSSPVEAANGTTNVKPAPNSYSDNEVFADTETDDESQTAETSGARQEAKLKNDEAVVRFATKSTTLQGRDSPLVFPNSTRDLRESLSQPGANPSTLNSLPSEDEIASPALLHRAIAAEPHTGGDLSEINCLTSPINDREIDCNKIKIKKRSELTPQITKGAAPEASSFEDSNEDRDDLDDDSDIDESANKSKHRTRNVSITSNQAATSRASRDYNNNEEVDYTNMEDNLFDNERNPYTGTYGVLLAGRRRKKAKTYLIGPNERGYTRKNSICKLKSNVLGTQFNAIRINQTENNDRCTVASISYETNVLGFKGPRKMRVFLAKDSEGEFFKSLPETFKKNPDAVVQLKNMTPSWNVESQSYVLNFHGRVTQASVKNFQLIECDDQLTEGHKYDNQQLSIGQSVNKAHLTKDVSQNQYENKTQFNHHQFKQHQELSDDNSHTKIIGESFSSRSGDKRKDRSALENNTNKSLNSSSLSNNNNNDKDNGYTENLDPDESSLQKTHRSLTYNSSIVMQFGRISSHEFTCDVAYPLSILQAFAIALSSFDSKLACE